jgi:hypothetical protein
MSKKYSTEFKKKLKDKLENIFENNKIDIIKDIIFKYNPDLSYTQNSSGLLLFFHNLNPITYEKLEHFIIKLEHSKIKKITSTMTDDDLSISESISTTKLNFNHNKNNVRLNSLEKNLIKKKDYFEKLELENNINEEKIDNDNENIFMHKNEDVVINIKLESNQNQNKNKLESNQNKRSKTKSK